MGEYYNTQRHIHELRKEILMRKIIIGELVTDKLKQEYAYRYEHKDILEYDGKTFDSLQEVIEYINYLMDCEAEGLDNAENELDEAYGYLVELRSIDGE